MNKQVCVGGSCRLLPAMLPAERTRRWDKTAQRVRGGRPSLPQQLLHTFSLLLDSMKHCF